MAASSVRMISSKQAFDTVAAGSPCVITGFAFEHMVQVSNHPPPCTAGTSSSELLQT